MLLRVPKRYHIIMNPNNPILCTWLYLYHILVMLFVLDYILVYSRSSEIDRNHKNEMEISGSQWFHPKWKICWATPKSPRQIRKRLRQCWAQSNSIQQENNQIQRHSVIHLRNEEAPTPAASYKPFVSWFFQIYIHPYIRSSAFYIKRKNQAQSLEHSKSTPSKKTNKKVGEGSLEWAELRHHCVPLSPLHDFLLRRSWVQSGL